MFFFTQHTFHLSIIYTDIANGHFTASQHNPSVGTVDYKDQIYNNINYHTSNQHFYSRTAPAVSANLIYIADK